MQKCVTASLQTMQHFHWRFYINRQNRYRRFSLSEPISSIQSIRTDIVHSINSVYPSRYRQFSLSGPISSIQSNRTDIVHSVYQIDVTSFNVWLTSVTKSSVTICWATRVIPVNDVIHSTLFLNYMYPNNCCFKYLLLKNKIYISQPFLNF